MKNHHLEHGRWSQPEYGKWDIRPACEYPHIWSTQLTAQITDRKYSLSIIYLYKNILKCQQILWWKQIMGTQRHMQSSEIARGRLIRELLLDDLRHRNTPHPACSTSHMNELFDWQRAHMGNLKKKKSQIVLFSLTLILTTHTSLHRDVKY